MTESDKKIGEWLRARLIQAGKKPIELARHLRIPPSRVYEMLKGSRRLQSSEIEPTATFLHVPTSELFSLLGISAPVLTSPSSNGHSDTGAQITVWRCELTEVGESKMLAEVAGQVSRPEHLRFANRTFGITVLNNLNAPVYNVRDKLIINPDEPFQESDDCFFSNAMGGEEGVFHIGKLMKISDKSWTVQMYNQSKPLVLLRSQFKHAWPIVGRYIIRG